MIGGAQREERLDQLLENNEVPQAPNPMITGGIRIFGGMARCPMPGLG
jgi:hypothetical protein